MKGFSLIFICYYKLPAFHSYNSHSWFTFFAVSWMSALCHLDYQFSWYLWVSTIFYWKKEDYIKWHWQHCRCIMHTMQTYLLLCAPFWMMILLCEKKNQFANISVGEIHFTRARMLHIIKGRRDLDNTNRLRSGKPSFMHKIFFFQIRFTYVSWL